MSLILLYFLLFIYNETYIRKFPNKSWAVFERLVNNRTMPFSRENKEGSENILMSNK